MATCVFYLDEAGSPYGHHEPLENGETPIFTLAALAFPLAEWRARDRGFLQMKRQFFPDLMGRENERDEEREVKGREIASPHNRNSSRRHEFNRRVLGFIRQQSGTGFGVTILKNPVAPASHRSIYTLALQILVERFNAYIAEHHEYDNGIIICDSRMKGVDRGGDLTVARSHLSFIFGHETGRTFQHILEAPMFADSRLMVGLQLCDIFASNLFTNHYHHHFRDPGGGLDYSHMSAYWQAMRGLEFKSNRLHDGHRLFGYRVISHRDRGNGGTGSS